MHMVTSVIEFVAWVLWLGWALNGEGDGRLFGWWSSTVGWWGSVLAFPVPVVFAFFQLAFDTEMGGMEGNYYQEFGE